MWILFSFISRIENSLFSLLIMEFTEFVFELKALNFNFNEVNILHNWEKHYQKSVATFLANEINTERYIAGLTLHVQIVFPQGIWRLFLWHRWLNSERKRNSAWCITLHRKIIELICCTRRLLNVTKSRLNNRICQHCGVKTNTVTPSFYFVLNISLSCNNSIRSFIGNLWRVLLLRNHLKDFDVSLHV